MDQAAKISNKAIGKQDVYLLSDSVQDSPFLPKNKRHSEFIKYHRSRNVVKPPNVSGWPFGQQVKVEFKPQSMGDLLSNMWLSLTLPKLETGRNYADQVGRHIFKSITMYVDEIEVEKIYDDWTIIHDEQYLEFSEKVANAYLVNRNLGLDNATLSQFSELAEYETELMIPIPFFFSRKYVGDEYKLNEPNKPFFPLASIHKQNITFEIDFHKQSFFTDTLQTIILDSFDIITEEITVSESERLFMMKESNEIVTEFVKRHPSTTTTIGDTMVTNNLSPIIPVKTFHWFFRRDDFENEEVSRQPLSTNQEEYYYQNRFNFSTSPSFSSVNAFFNPVMKKAFLYLIDNRLPNITDATSNYYKYKIPVDVRLSIPIRNIYTYSFAIHPMNTEPSGVLDFATIQSDKTLIKAEVADISNTYSMHMYYIGYQTVKFENGFMSFI
jgi:hypothetical protein